MKSKKAKKKEKNESLDMNKSGKDENETKNNNSEDELIKFVMKNGKYSNTLQEREENSVYTIKSVGEDKKSVFEYTINLTKQIM